TCPRVCHYFSSPSFSVFIIPPSSSLPSPLSLHDALPICLGVTPYPGMHVDSHFYQRLVDGYRMDQPRLAPDEIYRLMLDCWKEKIGRAHVNSSHVSISYAVFCLKQKIKTNI